MNYRLFFESVCVCLKHYKPVGKDEVVSAKNDVLVISIFAMLKTRNKEHD